MNEFFILGGLFSSPVLAIIYFVVWLFFKRTASIVSRIKVSVVVYLLIGILALLFTRVLNPLGGYYSMKNYFFDVLSPVVFWPTDLLFYFFDHH